ncbi:Late embryogenesis abundant protein [Forsythia ovata]|uniref:Late embryogenesis abundant protein n=1 Tax=Forsythia ovata TaxID=205694 RepID=A0ABD1QTL0_9LAMI
MTNNYKIETSEDEALLRSYPYAALYFVQSPSAVSHAYESGYQSPLPYENTFINPNNTNRLALSRYSNSSHGSNNSFLHVDKKNKSCDETAQYNGEDPNSIEINPNVVEDEDDDDDDESKNSNGWWKYFSFSYSTSSSWICLQIFWRLVLSIMISLIVFYIATKPPKPRMSIKMAGIRPFELGEGVDASGVTTKMLTCNCSMDIIIDNNSKLFGLHIHPPVLKMFFGNLPFAMSQGAEVYAGSDGSTLFKLNVGTRSKAMYGAGRNMEDLLKSGKGLPLIIRLSFTSSFNVVWGLIQPKYHHQAQCLLLLGNTYDNKHRTQTFKSTCIATSFSH